ncbi:uncharacterized protein LY89DRAFT_398988 [Mollisia scopiformis]|uniref:Uncharacterized protein n=1 Tax=Mollisia scopiformis TaxID=149040 RepID=A0A132B366_MOLSC|nr:uncharacterized protein LY89DRAFT_398988 [Mollisia scopiformis]KUJ06845.1 hypothetical protein LY89DRAFT_398988 [Mollisia scopiformis]
MRMRDQHAEIERNRAMIADLQLRARVPDELRRQPREFRYNPDEFRRQGLEFRPQHEPIREAIVINDLEIRQLGGWIQLPKQNVEAAPQQHDPKSEKDKAIPELDLPFHQQLSLPRYELDQPPRAKAEMLYTMVQEVPRKAGQHELREDDRLKGEEKLLQNIGFAHFPAQLELNPNLRPVNGKALAPDLGALNRRLADFRGRHLRKFWRRRRVPAVAAEEAVRPQPEESNEEDLGAIAARLVEESLFVADAEKADDADSID